MMIKLSLRILKHPIIKTYRGVEVLLHAFLILALDVGEVQIRDSFNPGDRSSVAHWIIPALPGTELQLSIP
jgi:hypothetical protein